MRAIAARDGSGSVARTALPKALDRPLDDRARRGSWPRRGRRRCRRAARRGPPAPRRRRGCRRWRPRPRSGSASAMGPPGARGFPRRRSARDRASSRRASDSRRRKRRRRGSRARPAGDEARISSRSKAAFSPAGAATSASRVQGKFSIQFACEPEGSISCTFAQVCGAFHQLWNLIESLGAVGHHVAGKRRDRLVAAMPVDDEDAPETRAAHGGDHVAHDREQRLDRRRDRAGEVGEIGRDAEGHHRKDRHAERLGRLDGDPLGEDEIDAEREIARAAPSSRSAGRSGRRRAR